MRVALNARLALLVLLGAANTPLLAQMRQSRTRTMSGRQQTGIAAVQDNPSYGAAFESLLGFEPRADMVAPVSGVTLRRDVGEISLLDGVVYLLTPVQDRTVGAVFLGRGEFRFSPPTRVEQDQLYRYMETRSLAADFTSLFLAFGDRTFDEMATFLNGESNDQFYAHMTDETGTQTFFEIDPYSEEGVRLSRPVVGSGSDEFSETICQFRKQVGSDSREILPEENGGTTRIDSYILETEIEDNLDFSARADVSLTPTVDGGSWLWLSLYRELTVDSARWGGGEPAEFFRGEDASILWIKTAPAFGAGEKHTLSLFYHGDLIERRVDGIFVGGQLVEQEEFRWVTR